MSFPVSHIYDTFQHQEENLGIYQVHHLFFSVNGYVNQILSFQPLEIRRVTELQTT